MSLHPNEVLLAPVVSEKSYAQIEGSNTYSFRIHPDAHKTQVRQAVEELFGVKVLRVNVAKVQPKPKRRGFHRGPKTHGSHNIRKPGSIGASATPSRVFKGIKMAGRMGGKRITQVGLVVHEVRPDENLLLVKGAVPGPKNGFVEVREATR